MTGIVVGADGSPAGVAALEWALAEAVARQLPLVLVRAWNISAYGLYGPVGMALTDRHLEGERLAEELAEALLKDASDRVPGADGVPVTVKAVLGASAQVLVDASRDAPLVVVGSRGAAPLSRAVLGSVSSSVLHHALCPVAVVPVPRASQQPRARVVVGVDHSPESLAALAWAVETARLRDADLVPATVHAEEITPGADPDHKPVSLPQLEASERASLVHAATAAGADEAHLDPRVLTGHASRALLDLAEDADLLVVGSRGRGGFSALLLGSTSTQCAQHATCPVVVVRAG